MDRGEFCRRMNDVRATISDASKEEMRTILKYLVTRILNDDNGAELEYWVRRLADELAVMTYDLVKNRGQFPFMPREVAGLKREDPQ